MSCFGGGLGAGGVEIPSNLLISSGCLGLSGLNLTDWACACGALWACIGGGGSGLVGLCRVGPKGLGSLMQGAGVCGGIGHGSGALTLRLRRSSINSAFLNRE